MRKIDLAYTAGILDGEGCIGIYPRGRRRMHRAEVRIHNTNEWLIQWLRFAYGGSVYYTEPKQGENHKPCWMWVVSGKKALIFLQLIYPYLRLKKPQAELAVKFLRVRRGTGYDSTEEELAIAEAQRIVMNKMNKTGRSPL